LAEREQTLRLAAEIKRGAKDVSEIAELAQRRYREAQLQGALDDDVWKRALGSYLHDFYSSVEALLRSVAQATGEGLPSGDAWHRQLLSQMAVDIEQVRPALISEHVEVQLREYLGFRHVYRNVYGHRLDISRMKSLLDGLQAINTQLQEEIGAFADHLLRLATKLAE